MLPLSWNRWLNIHPFAPKNQAIGYEKVLNKLENQLKEITGFDGVSLQPNSGAQGEYAGLMVIKSYHENNGDFDRNICLFLLQHMEQIQLVQLWLECKLLL